MVSSWSARVGEDCPNAVFEPSPKVIRPKLRFVYAESVYLQPVSRPRVGPWFGKSTLGGDDHGGQFFGRWIRIGPNLLEQKRSNKQKQANCFSQ